MLDMVDRDDDVIVSFESHTTHGHILVESSTCRLGNRCLDPQGLEEAVSQVLEFLSQFLVELSFDIVLDRTDLRVDLILKSRLDVRMLFKIAD